LIEPQAADPHVALATMHCIDSFFLSWKSVKINYRLGIDTQTDDAMPDEFVGCTS
jgi:hypothetical protein